VAVPGQRLQRAGLGQRAPRALVQAGAQAQVAHVGERAPGPRGDDRQRRALRQPGDLAQAQADAGLAVVIARAAAHTPAFQGVVPVAAGHVHRQHLHRAASAAAGATRVLDDLAGRIEAHRLRVEQRAGEGRRFMPLEPAADVDQLGERGGVALREAVGAEPFYLLEDLLDECVRVVLLLHQRADLLAVRLHVAAAAPDRHRAPQVVRFVLLVAGMDHQLHHLFLEQGNAQRGLQNVPDAIGGVGHLLAALPPPQVRMHHVALDRPGAHDRYLDHQVVEARRLQPRQHAHLRARFDLEHAHGVGGLDHGVGRFVAGRQPRQVDALAAVALHQLQCLADAGEHAQRQAVDLEQLHRLQVVLVPLDDGAPVHGCVLHRDHSGQRRIADHETAHVLRQVARVAVQLRGDRHQPPDQRVVRVEAGLAQALRHRHLAIAPAMASGQQRDLVRRQAEGAGHVAHRAPAAVADHRGRQRGAVAAVLGVDVLQHFLAPLVLEVHVDVRRLVALARQEARHQQPALGRVHHGDAQREAHRGIGRGTAPLAQDAVLLRETDDVLHGQEERLVLLVGDQFQFAFDLPDHIGRHAFRPALAHAAFGQFAQPAAGRVLVGHQLGRVAVLQLAQVEAATARQPHRVLQQRRRMDVAQRAAGAQVALAIAEQVRAAFGQRQVVADGGHRVLQHAPAAHVHVHVAAGQWRHRQRIGQRQQLLQARGVVLLAVQFHRQVRACAEQRPQPAPLFRLRLGARQPQREQARGLRIGAAQHRFHVRPCQPVRALAGRQAAAADQLAQARVTVGGFHQQHAAQAAGQGELAADHQPDAAGACRLPGAHDAGQRAFVGDRQRFVTTVARTREQFLGAGRAAQEREIRQAMQFGIGRQGVLAGRAVVGGHAPQALRHFPGARHAGAGMRIAGFAAAHANHPCSIQPPCSPGGANAQARWPCEVSST